MATKKIVQDIVPNERRSIRNIRLDRDVEPAIKKPARRKIVEKREEREEEKEEERIDEIEKEEEEVHVKKPRPHKKSNFSFKFIITSILIFVSLAVIGIGLSLSYSKATVTITPKVVDFDVDGDTITAKKKTPTSNPDDITYEVISASQSITEEVTATKGALVQTKAKGTAIIYNNYSTSPQTLVAGTRLATTDGLVYRTSSTISVPGKKGTTPGSISVNITADQVGEKYNIKIADLKGDFKLLGYKGTDKYNAFYGRLKTDLTGGFSGNKVVINEELKKATISSIQTKLKEELFNKLKQNLTEDNILYDSAYNVEYVVKEPVIKDGSLAQITVEGTAYGAIFNSDSLIKKIAGREIKKFPSDTYTIEGDRELQFKISNTKDVSIKKGTSIIFTLKGPVKITGTIDENKLKEELVGIKLKDSNSIFAKYSAITKAYAVITPFWLRSFPNSVDKINIEYK